MLRELSQLDWWFILQVIYTIIIILVCIRIVYDTRSVPKTLAYLLLTVFIPVLGIIFYFSFGINYRKRKIYNKKLVIDDELKRDFYDKVKQLRAHIYENADEILIQNQELIRLLSNKRMGADLILPNYKLELLLNGEQFFPRLKEQLLKATHHIHIEFYIFEDDTIGNEIKEILIQKAYAGVEVRFIYDDFGSMSIRNGFVRDLRNHGVQVFPFNEIKIVKLANRLNYRNHRKIVVIDGETSFVGGINICDKYNNDYGNDLYWRDTHLMIKGFASQGLQRVFLSDWNFCSYENITVNRNYFPEVTLRKDLGKYVQIVSSGPDSDMPNILYSIVQAINLAEKEILITTPYYIPDIILQEMLIIASLSGLDVRLLVPKRGDSRFVSIAMHSFYKELLTAGVKIYEYNKGFIHAKTFVMDRRLSSVGTANMDSRSFDLNFEVQAIIYDEELANQLADSFYKDLDTAEEIKLDKWRNRSQFTKIKEKLVRLMSPFM